MATYSYPVTFANGKQGAIDSPVELSDDALQGQIAVYDEQDRQADLAAAQRYQADQQEGRLGSYGGTAVRSFISPLAGTARGLGEIFDSPTLVRGGNELEQGTATRFPANPQYANDPAGKIIGTTANLVGGALPFFTPVVGEVAGPASIFPQVYDSGFQTAINAGLPVSTAQDYASTHVALQAPLLLGAGRIVKGAIVGSNVLPSLATDTLPGRLANLGVASAEAGAIGSGAKLAENIQAGPLGYNIDPNRGALDDVLASGGLMAAGAGLLGVPSVLLRGRGASSPATPERQTAVDEPVPATEATTPPESDGSAPSSVDPVTGDTAFPDITVTRSGGKSTITKQGATGTSSFTVPTSQEAATIASLRTQPSTVPPQARNTVSPLATEPFVDVDATVVPPDTGIDANEAFYQEYQAQQNEALLARIRANAEASRLRVEAQRAREAARQENVASAVTDAAQTADNAEASAAPQTAQALRQIAQETLATTTPSTESQYPQMRQQAHDALGQVWPGLNPTDADNALGLTGEGFTGRLQSRYDALPDVQRQAVDDFFARHDAVADDLLKERDYHYASQALAEQAQQGDARGFGQELVARLRDIENQPANQRDGLRARLLQSASEQARANGLDPAVIQQEARSALGSIYGNDAAEMADHYFRSVPSVSRAPTSLSLPDLSTPELSAERAPQASAPPAGVEQFRSPIETDPSATAPEQTAESVRPVATDVPTRLEGSDTPSLASVPPESAEVQPAAVADTSSPAENIAQSRIPSPETTQANIQRQINRTSNAWMTGQMDPLDLDPARSLSNVQIPKELGERFQGHGLRLGSKELSELSALLTKGIDVNRPFHSTDLSSDKDSAGTAGLGGNANTRSGIFTLVSKPDAQFKEDGIGGVLVDDKHAAIIPELSKQFPRVPFAKASDATTLMRDLLNRPQEQTPRLDNRGKPIATVESDPTEAMRASPNVEATGDTVTELPPQTYGSRTSSDYFHLPQERSEYTRQTAALEPVANEADLLTQANTALQRRRYEVENKVGGYEGRGGTNAVDRVLSAAYLKYQRNLREGTSGKNGYKPAEVGQVLNNVIRDFQKGASKRRGNVELDAPVNEGTTIADTVPDDAPTPYHQVASLELANAFTDVRGQYELGLTDVEKTQLSRVLDRVAAGQTLDKLSPADRQLFNGFQEYAAERLGAFRETERGIDGGDASTDAARQRGQPAAQDQSGNRSGQDDGRQVDANAQRGSAGEADVVGSTPSGSGRDAQALEARTDYTEPASNLTPDQSRVLGDSLMNASGALEQLGIPLRETSNPNEASRGMAIAYHSDGTISFEVNRNALAESLKSFDTPAEANAYVRAAVVEELIHATDAAQEQEAWRAAGRKGDFLDFVQARKRALLDNITSDLRSASPEVRTTLEGALLDGWNLYRDPQGQTRVNVAEARRLVGEGNELFSFGKLDDLTNFLAESPDRVPGYMMETLRQLVQLRNTDPSITTETAYINVLQRFRDFVNNLLNRLRAVAADPKAYSPALADAIKRVEEVQRGMDDLADTRLASEAARVEAPTPRPFREEPSERAHSAVDPSTDPYRAESDFIESLTGIKTPAPPKAKLQFPSAREAAGRAVEGARTFRQKAVEYVKGIGDIKPLTDKDVLLRRVSENEQYNDNFARNIQKAIVDAVPDKAVREAIDVYRDLGGDRTKLEQAAAEAKKPEQRARYERALNLSTNELKVAFSLDELYKRLGQDAVDRGYLDSLRENYANRYVQRPFLERLGLQDASGGGVGRFPRKFRSANERYYETIPDVEKSGRNLDTYDAAELAARYVHEYGRIRLAEQFKQDIADAKASDGRPLADVRSDAPKVSPDATDEEFEVAKQATRHDYQPNGNPGLLGNLAFHPEATRSNGRSGDIRNLFKTGAIAKYLNSPSGNAGEAAFKLSVRGIRKAQNVIRSTMFDLSPFHATTEGVGAAGHGVNPFGKIEHFDPANPFHQEAIASGLQIIPRIGSERQFAADLQGGSDSLVRKIPGIGKAAEKLSEFVFEDYIPSLKLKIFQKALGRNLELAKADLASGKLTRQDVAATTAEQVNDHLGHQNYTAMARNPTTREIMSIVALAPDFLESRYKFARGAVQGLRGNIGTREQLRTFAILFGAQFLATRIFNKALDDDYHWDHPFSFIHGNRSYTLRSVPEDLLAAIVDPAKFAAGRESPLVRTGVQLLTGRNYRGEKVTAAETLQEQATAGVPIGLKGLPGFDRLNVTQRNQVQSWFDRVANFAGLNAHRLNPEESLYALANKYKQSQGIKEDAGAYPTSPYSPVKSALADGNLDRAKQELQSIVDSGKSRVQIMRGLQASILHPYTTSQKMDAQFIASLSPDDRARVREAQAARVKLLGQARQLVTSLPNTPVVSREAVAMR